jgi:hypothetical protein
MARIALQPTTRTPEKILVVGSGGTGKSYNAVQIARRCLLPSQTMFVIDTEQAFPVLLEELGMGTREEWVGDQRDTAWDDADSNIVRYWARDWPEQRWAIKTAFGRAKPGDWVVVDSITHPWSDVQAWYMGIVNGGMEMGDWLVQTIASARAEGKKDEGAGEMLREWRPINSQWIDYVRKPIMRAGCHVYLTAHAKTINTERDSAEVKTMWGKFGLKADTQKGMGHDVRTVLGMERSRGAGGGWKVQTVKDWGREDRELERVELVDVPTTYLKSVAGWKMTKV